MNLVIAALPAFLASLVEFVEALTIVLAVGVTRQWRSTILGVVAATIVLVLAIGVFGAALVMFVPIELLRLLVWIAIQAGLDPTLAGGLLTVLILTLAGLSVWSASRRVT